MKIKTLSTVIGAASLIAATSKKAMAKLISKQQKILTKEARKAGQRFRGEQQKEEKDLVASSGKRA